MAAWRRSGELGRICWDMIGYGRISSVRFGSGWVGYIRYIRTYLYCTRRRRGEKGRGGAVRKIERGETERRKREKEKRETRKVRADTINYEAGRGEREENIERTLIENRAKRRIERIREDGAQSIGRRERASNGKRKANNGRKRGREGEKKEDGWNMRISWARFGLWTLDLRLELVDKWSPVVGRWSLDAG